MNRIMLNGVLTGIFLLSMVISAWAELSIAITNQEGLPYTNWEIHNAQTNTVYVMNADEFVKISNDGTVTTDYKLRVSSPGAWTYSTTTNLNQCVLMGLFSQDDSMSYTPQESDFLISYDTIDESNTLTATEEPGYNGRFQGASPGASGYSVPAGTAKRLYFYLKTPSDINPIEQLQQIGITIEAIAH